MAVISSGAIAAILPGAFSLLPVPRSLLHTAASLRKLAQQCAVQWSVRDSNGPLPGSTADHRLFASKKIQPLQGAPRVQTPNISAPCVAWRRCILSYWVASRMLAQNTLKPLLLQRYQKMTRMREKHKALSNDVEGVSRKYTARDKLSPNSKPLEESKFSTSSAFLTSWESSSFD